MRQLVPAAEQLSPTLVAFSKLAPEAKGFFEGFATVIARSTTGFPALRKLLPRRVPAAPARGRPVPAQPQPDPHRPRPLQTRDHRGDGQRRRRPPTRCTSARPAKQRPLPAGDRALQPGIAGDLRQPHSRPTATAPTASRSPTGISPAACPTSTPAVQLGHHGDAQPRTRRTTRPSTERVEGEDMAKTEKNATEFFERLKQYAFAEQDNSANTPAPGCTPAGARSSRSTAAGRRPPTSTPSNRANRGVRGALLGQRAGLRR